MEVKLSETDQLHDDGNQPVLIKAQEELPFPEDGPRTSKEIIGEGKSMDLDKKELPGGSDPDPESETPAERRKKARQLTLALTKRAAVTGDWDFEMYDNVENMITHADTLKWILKQLASKTDEPAEKKPIADREIARPELERMSWMQWLEVPDNATRPHHAAIDVLISEPRVRSNDASGQRRRMDGHRTLNPESPVDAALADKRPLPARIRINSVPAKRILDGFCNDELRFTGETDPLILQRPFKLLTWYEGPIRDRLKELREFLAAREAKLLEQPDNRQADQLRERKFPRDSIFFTGTDWDILTVAEVKEAVDDFACVIEFMDTYMTPLRRRLQDSPTEVHFHDIWHLFDIHKYVYVKETPQKIWKVIQATGGRKYLSPPESELKNWQDKYSPFTVDCYYLDYDGVHIVPVYGRFTIEKYDDSTQIASLPIMPISAADIDIEGIRTRGQEFLTYTTSRHRSYRGWTLSHSPDGRDLVKPIPNTTSVQRVFSERIESQVVVDFERAIQANPEWSPRRSELKLYKADDAECQDGIATIDTDSVWDARHSEELLERERKIWQSWEKGGELPHDDYLLLFPDRVFAYILRTRTWACLQIGSTGTNRGQLLEVKTREQPWKDLEIPDAHKSIVQALIKTHFSTDKSGDAQFDLVQNKGKGVIVLLHGVPGVGKTATAECVAESERRPLLPITCGDLGLQPKEVEATLQTSFQLAQAWGCVMLLDEADIFLAERTNADIERNALVSVFLRILEYYEGILFLTTNRVGSFDEAFKSRIHMALYYPPLNQEQTEKIWKAHVERIEKVSTEVICHKEQLLDFARTLFQSQKNSLESIGPVWNGRQIRNAFQSAVALARNEVALPAPKSIMVEIRHFHKVAEVSNEFNNYIWRVKKGRDDAYFAGHRGLRDDGYAGMHVQSNTPDPRSGGHTFATMPMMQNASQGTFPNQFNPSVNQQPGGYTMQPQNVGYGQQLVQMSAPGQSQMFAAQPGVAYQQQQVGGMQQPTQQYSQYYGAQQPAPQATNTQNGQQYQPHPQQQQQQQQAPAFVSNMGIAQSPPPHPSMSQQQQQQMPPNIQMSGSTVPHQGQC